MLKLNLDIRMGGVSEEMSDIDEPVSPPACLPEEGPTLVLPQSIEEIASEVVGENWSLPTTIQRESSETDCSYIPKTVEKEKKERKDSMGSMIPVTVSEISEDPLPCSQPSTLHMSGGMVSTDMTLHMSSVPTSVITTNTNTALGEQRIGNILQYFKQPDFLQAADRYVPPKPPRTKNNLSHSEMFLNLPMDLSITKVTKINGQVSETEDVTVSNKMKVPDDDTKQVYGVKRLADGVDDNRAKRLKKDKGGFLKTMSCDDEKVEPMVKNSSGPDPDYLDCKLILPRENNEKARIVFTNGMVVEIAREIFNNLEENIFENKLMSKTINKKKGARAKTDIKLEISKKKPKKQSHKDAQKSAPTEKALDKNPKAMPMIVKNNNNVFDDITQNSLAKSVQHLANIPSPSVSPTTFIQSNKAKSAPISSPTAPTETPPPSPPCPSPPSPSPPSFPPGLHKLPSIVRKPSYYAKTEVRKMLKAKC